jgi:hypothetical protein
MAEQDSPEKAARDARLDALKVAAEDWGKRETKRLKDQVALSKRMLKGRTGSERLANATTASVSNLTVDEINTFLTGDLA